MPYTNPPALSREIDELECQIRHFEAGDLDPAAMKARRVPFGLYEQRTAGTYMCRIRCTGGTVTPAQFTGVARLAERYGSPFVHLTTRQDLQIHDLRIGEAPALLRELLALGLSSRGGGGNTVRNIVASDDAGHSGNEAFDIGPWVDALTDRLIREDDSWNMPRKLKIAFASDDRDTALAGFSDLGFFPRPGADGVPGFKIYAAGGLGNKPRVALPLYEFLPASEIHLLVVAVKKFFDRHGNRKNRRQARLRFLRDKFGDEGLLDRLREVVAEERARGFAPLAPATRPTAPSGAGAVSLPTASFANLAAADPERFALWKKRHVSPAKEESLFNVRIPVLLGDLPALAAIALGEGLASFGDDVLRLTSRQGLSLVGIPGSRLPEVFELLARLGLDGPGFAAGIVACTGADTCKLGMCLPKGATREIARRLASSDFDSDACEGPRIHVSGCPNTCAQHMVADLGFFGMGRRQGDRMYPAYRIVAGGTLGEGRSRLARDIAQVSAWMMPEFVEQALRAWKSAGIGIPFDRWLAEGGEQDLVAIAEALPPVPDWAVDRAPYTDWGAAEEFSPARGGAECSAGLFDLIEVDRKAIAAARRSLETAPGNAAAIHAIALSASRMLLVTRGLEPADERAVFQAFLESFVHAGLVPARIEAIVVAAREDGAAGLSLREAEVQELADIVEALYQGMDDSLRFPEIVPTATPSTARRLERKGKAAPEPTSPAAPAVEGIAFRDLRGVACPMNFVKVKLQLETMDAGGVLRVWLDDGEPIRNVPGSVASEGHEILGLIRQEEGHWEVAIRKR